MTEAIITIAVLIAGLVVEIVRRGLIRGDEQRKAKKEFDEKREQAIANDDIYSRYNK